MYKSEYGPDASAPPPYLSSLSTNTKTRSREEKFQEVVDKYEISMNFAQRLQQLNGFKIVYIFDDSGSMNATLMDSPLNKEDTLMRVTR